MRRINLYFSHNAELAALSDKARELGAYQKVWQTIAPETIRPYTQAGSVNHKRLTVYAANNAVAAKVKLLLPSLLTKLQKQGVEVTSIRVRVQVQSAPRRALPVQRRLSPAASATLQDLADQLEHDSPLAAALQKLARHRSPLT